MDAGRYHQAIEVFKANRDIFLKQPGVWHSLGDAYKALGQRVFAKQAYDKAEILKEEIHN